MNVCPAKTQIRLGIRPVWSESSQCTQWVAKDPAFLLGTAKILIRLGGCPGWSESSLGAQPFCWFCHFAAHIVNGKQLMLVRLLFEEQSNVGLHCLLRHTQYNSLPYSHVCWQCNLKAGSWSNEMHEHLILRILISFSLTMNNSTCIKKIKTTHFYWVPHFFSLKLVAFLCNRILSKSPKTNSKKI